MPTPGGHDARPVDAPARWVADAVVMPRSRAGSRSLPPASTATPRASTSGAARWHARPRSRAPSSARPGRRGGLPRVIAGVDQVALQHRVVLGRERHDDGGIFGALRLVDRRRVGRARAGRAPRRRRRSRGLEVDDELAGLESTDTTTADVAVVDLLVVVVLDLHHLVAGREGPSRSARGAASPVRVERRLQRQVQRLGAGGAAIHRAQHLDVAHRIQAEAARDPLAHESTARARPPARRRPHRRGRSRRSRRRRRSAASGPALTRCAAATIRLPAAWRKRAVRRATGTRRDAMQVGEHLARADRGQLIGVADEEQRGAVAAPRAAARASAARRPSTLRRRRARSQSSGVRSSRRKRPSAG